MIWNQRLGMLWVALMLLASGCFQEPQFPDEPTLEFLSLEPSTDGQAVLRLAFTDGDGNVGFLGENDEQAPFYLEENENGEDIKVYYNLYGDFEQRVNGEWESPFLFLPFAYKIPWVQPTGSSPAQDGVIEVEMQSWHLLGSGADSVRFGWTLWDRDLNASNQATSGSLAVP